jgi:uncharacterized membrane protein YbhN (UPF0104 family)
MTRQPAPGRRSLRFVARLVVGLVLLALILRRVGVPDFGVAVGGRLVAGVLGAALLLLLGQAIAALRWKIVLGPGSPRWAYLTRLYYVGAFFSLFLPTVVGGDVVRAAAAAEATRRPGGVIASVLLDRALGVLALVSYGLLGLVLAPEVTGRLAAAARLRLPGAGALLPALLALLVIGGGVWFAYRSPRLRAMAAEGWAAVRDLARAPRSLVTAILLGFVVQGLYILLWVVLARAVALPVSDRTLLLGVPVVSLLAMLPVTLNGLGVREGAWLLLLAGSGIPDQRIVGYSLLFFVTNLVTGLFGGVLFVLLGTGARPTKLPS